MGDAVAVKANRELMSQAAVYILIMSVVGLQMLKECVAGAFAMRVNNEEQLGQKSDKNQDARLTVWT